MKLMTAIGRVMALAVGWRKMLDLIDVRASSKIASWHQAETPV
jgi:hypothetical protein